MKDLKLLTWSELLDLLVEQTEYHTQLMTKGARSEQFRISRELLKKLQQEIELRKSTDKPSQNITDLQDQTSLEIQN